MKTSQCYFAMVLILVSFSCLYSKAATHYVVMPGTEGVNPTEPFTSWETAGTNIPYVIELATTGEVPRIVWVTNGTYYPNNQIVITNDLQLKSVNGYTNTILNGAATTNRCIYLVDYDGTSLLKGFTITNYTKMARVSGGIYAYKTEIFDCLITDNKITTSDGQSYGAGIYIAGSTMISNCIVRNNSTARSAAGIYLNGGSCQFLDSLIENNTASGYFGGGLAIISGSSILVSNCTIINNKYTGNNPIGGGGILVYNNAGTDRKIIDCVITGNTSKTFGGGVRFFGAGSAEFINCTITGNSATNTGGGVCAEQLLTLRNCLVARNAAGTNGGGIYLSTTTNIVENCTVVSNYAGETGGGMYLQVAGTATNNIIYYNTAGVSADNFTNAAGNTGLSYCCVFPAVDGTANITEDPRLVDPAGGNYRLREDSPCINAGTNLGWVTTATDLDGRTRKRYEIVDMGAYEKIRQGTIYFGH